jgi:hypothetical protein
MWIVKKAQIHDCVEHYEMTSKCNIIKKVPSFGKHHPKNNRMAKSVSSKSTESEASEVEKLKDQLAHLPKSEMPSCVSPMLASPTTAYCSGIERFEGRCCS